ncbi:MAG: hypothetical protein WD607_10145 [Candidatus Paceibacterota bacterium]
MVELLTELRKKYDLTLGSKFFSPIMQCSIGLAMKYHEEVKNGFDKAFHLNFPDKQDSALWLSVALMRNFLLEDYILQPANRIEDFGIKKGDKVELFSAVCTYEGSSKDKILLGFSDQDSPIAITNKLVRYVNLTDKNRVNKYRLFGKKKKEARKDRNAISKLLEPTEPILINEKILESKVLVIAGRGETGNFSQRLKEESLYETSFYDLFNCGENLIIKPDLEDYTFLGKKEDPNVEERFKDRFLRFINELIEELPDRKNDIDSLVENINENDFRTKEFKNLFDEIVSECDQESKYHKIKENYPGIKEKLPKNLKSVVINDIIQLETYRGVIEELLRRGIPVLVISNRYIEDKKALSFFDNYFKTNTEDLRLSWDKKKIRAIDSSTLKDGNILDYELWNKCLKFSKQKIEIETTESHPVDELILIVQRAVSKLEGHERLQNAYWRYFNPLVYSFKNSVTWAFYHDELLEKFLSLFEEVKSTLSQETRSVFDQIINELKYCTSSNKTFEDNTALFSQQIDLEGKTVLFPEGDFKNLTVDNIESDTSEITFPGFPLNEPINNYLLDSISEYIITKIKLVCWPKEGELTYHYIFNRLKAGYFSDNIPTIWNFPANLILKNNNDIQDEINESLLLDLAEKSEIEETKFEDEEVLRKISSFKYSPYQPNTTSEESYIVKCNIIDFVGNKFMFLPKNSTVLAKIETDGSDFIFKRASFSDLSPGDELFQYDLPRHELREISKKVDGSDVIFNELEIWKDSLKKTYQKHDNNVYSVVEKLDKLNQTLSIGGSPTYQNLRNWLFDDDMHAPSEKNLKMILAADPDESKINKIPDIVKAAKAAKSLSQRISRKIKKAITTKLNEKSQTDSDEIFIEIQGTIIKVKFSKIVQLQEADIEIEYQNTRKIVG